MDSHFMLLRFRISAGVLFRRGFIAQVCYSKNPFLHFNGSGTVGVCVALYFQSPYFNYFRDGLNFRNLYYRFHINDPNYALFWDGGTHGCKTDVVVY